MRSISEENKNKIEEAAKRGRETQATKKSKRIEDYNKDPKLCKFCLTPLSYEKKKLTYCNHSCAASFNNLGVCRTISKIKENKVVKNKEYYRNKFRLGEVLDPATVRKYIKEIYSSCCKCNISEWNGIALTLEIHHKDGNSSNNKPDNLEILCPNCHTQTDNHRSKNIGNGRFYRRQRYEESKSY
jgi:5-methylcytosine-specific restriction endonuclease McrA